VSSLAQNRSAFARSRAARRYIARAEAAFSRGDERLAIELMRRMYELTDESDDYEHARADGRVVTVRPLSEARS
jgi:phage shock protein A